MPSAGGPRQKEHGNVYLGSGSRVERDGYPKVANGNGCPDISQRETLDTEVQGRWGFHIWRWGMWHVSVGSGGHGK